MRYLFLFAFYIFFIHSLSAQYNITGKVVNEESNLPLADVKVDLSELRLQTSTDSSGRFQFLNIPPGKFFLEIDHEGFAPIVIQVEAGTSKDLNIGLSHAAIEINEVVVTGVSNTTERMRNPLPGVALKRETLLQNPSANIIDGITRLPGVNQFSTGTSISKPVIRGLGYNRVVILRNSIRQEGQQWGDEHGLEMDENEVEKVEVVKGPGSIMYGSDAIAGVINFLTASALEEGKVNGEISSGYQSNANLLSTSVVQSGNLNGFSWMGRFSHKKAGNYKNQEDGYVLNSGLEEYNGSGFLGINRKWGYAQLHFSSFNQRLGLPEGERDSLGNFVMQKPLNDTSVQEISVAQNEMNGYKNSIGIPSQTVQHHRISITNKIFFKASKLTFDVGWQQNRRKEFGEVLAPDETELHFLLNTFNSDLRYFFPERKGWKLSAGMSSQMQSNRNFGAGYLIPEYRMNDAGTFIYTQKEIGAWFFGGGLRYDYRQINADALYLDDNGEAVPQSDSSELKFEALQKKYSNVTGSLGFSYLVKKVMAIRANVSKGFRTPNLAELSSNGRHEGSFRYELGNKNLKAENSYQADAGFTLNTKHVTFDVSTFYNKIENYIFSEKLKTNSGNDSVMDPSDPAPVFQFVQGNAALYGGEFALDVHPHPLDWLHIENSFSFVRGTLAGGTDSTKNLPFMPAPKFTSEISAHFDALGKLLSCTYFKIEGDYFFTQSMIYSAYGTETATPSYFLLNAGMGTDIINKKKKVVLSIFLAVNNLLDTKYQSHLSRLKYAPENPVTRQMGIYNPGRNFSVKVIVPISFK